MPFLIYLKKVPNEGNVVNMLIHVFNPNIRTGVSQVADEKIGTWFRYNKGGKDYIKHKIGTTDVYDGLDLLPELFF